MLDAQDVVGESCGSQFDSDASALLSARSERPFLASTSVKAADFPGSGLWQKHIQRDEAKPQRHSVDEWQNRDSQRFKTHQSASAMVLARKRKRDEQRRKGGDKRQCTDSDGTSELNGDSERDSLDMEEQLTAFVEYNSTDMDSLDINPSQDFDGDITDDVGQGIASQASQYMQTCGWEDLTDVTQFHEEASEVFDNVIYAPRRAQISVVNSASSFCRSQDKYASETARSSFARVMKAVPELKKMVAATKDEDSEASLSDVEQNFRATAKSATRPPDQGPPSPKTPQKPEWMQRRSVKRDCSFIDGHCSSPKTQLLLTSSSTSAATPSTQELSSRVIELKDGCFDSSDDIQEGLSNEPLSMQTTCASDSVTAVSSAPPIGPGASCVAKGFQPRLARKRRKIGQQLTLDSFFSPKHR